MTIAASTPLSGLLAGLERGAAGALAVVEDYLRERGLPDGAGDPRLPEPLQLALRLVEQPRLPRPLRQRLVGCAVARAAVRLGASGPALLDRCTRSIELSGGWLAERCRDVQLRYGKAELADGAALRRACAAVPLPPDGRSAAAAVRACHLALAGWDPQARLGARGQPLLDERRYAEQAAAEATALLAALGRELVAHGW